MKFSSGNLLEILHSKSLIIYRSEKYLEETF